ncbi:agmatinase family protein [Cytobacillus horneckiae]|uniref:Agmatinase n=1 Tax=Cytobacillus horneckiae TaxID=549687 RepID=A0A2N0ZJ67_9BACI|nr:agmatinase family protein [Cytobacillus horneckiae]MEC1153933.1 agmatinase family protein [Cytobacillus horneckiae]MED2938508.1 agmatinase family protein [Cytobacillus horneckiae]PKG29562.1 agmatinase [Cytobacillus horneckiae]
MNTNGQKALELAAQISTTEKEKRKVKEIEMGLPASESVTDENITTFVRGEHPSYAGLATFLRSTYLEDVSKVGEVDVAFVGAPFDAGTTFRPGTRFGPEAMRNISKLYQTYHFEAGIDLKEHIKMADIGDIYSVHNLEKQFDQLSKAVSHIVNNGTFPVVLGGDHSIAYGTIKGLAEATEGKVGVIQLDRHLDMQEKEMDERMHDTPLFHASNLPNVDPKNIVHIGIGGWQNDVKGALAAKERGNTVLTMDDVDELGIDRIAEIALEKAWADGVEAVYLTIDVDCIDSGISMGTGWPEPGGFLPREVLRLVKKLAEKGLAGLEVVEVSPPYDHNNQTALMGTRIVCDVLSSLVKNKHLGA